MKVCHLTSAHDSNDTRIFYKECVSLAKAGYDTYLVARGQSRIEYGVNVIGIGSFSGGRLKRMFKFTKDIYFAGLALNADIYHLHDPELLPYIKKLKAAGKKVIFDSHEFYVEQIKYKAYIPKVLRGFIAAMYGAYERSCLKKADAVVAVCSYSGKNTFDYVKKTVYIANYPVLSEIAGSLNNINKPCEYACYVGTLAQQRGVINAIKACGISKTKLHLAGNYSPPEFKLEAESTFGYDFVTYHGYVNRTEINNILEQSFVGICNLLNVGQYDKIDTFPIKVYEYMGSGLPVILSKNPYAEKMLSNYPFGIAVDPENPEDIAKALIYIKENPNIAAEMGTIGFETVKSLYNWETQARKLISLYEEL